MTSTRYARKLQFATEMKFFLWKIKRICKSQTFQNSFVLDSISSFYIISKYFPAISIN